MSAERWLAPLSGGVSGALFLGLVGLYVYGSSHPPEWSESAVIEVPVPPQTVIALLSDMPGRPAWRPQVARIGRIDDDPQGRPVWRELDAGDDRFDLVVIEVGADRVVLGTASPEQVGVDTVWTFEARPAPGGASLGLRAEGRVEQPLFRALFLLRGGPRESVAVELESIAAALGSPASTLRWQ